MMQRKFWMVAGLTKSGGITKAPTVQHFVEMSAREEAARLATSNPGQVFVVLEATESVRKTDLEWRDCLEGSPF
jgi:hypothetical protein